MLYLKKRQSHQEKFGHTGYEVKSSTYGLLSKLSQLDRYVFNLSSIGVNYKGRCLLFIFIFFYILK